MRRLPNLILLEIYQRRYRNVKNKKLKTKPATDPPEKWPKIKFAQRQASLAKIAQLAIEVAGSIPAAGLFCVTSLPRKFIKQRHPGFPW